MNNISNRQIWIADDDPFYSDTLDEIVEIALYNWTVRHFKNAAELQTALHEGQRPSAAILDMMLPMDEHDQKGGLQPDEDELAPGVLLAKLLIEHGVKAQAIAVITALIETKHRQPLLDLGVKGENILIKPALIEVILRAVDRVAGKFGGSHT